MVIRGATRVEAAMRKHSTLRRPLQQWIRIIEKGEWQNLIEMRKELPTADAIKGTELTCFNIGGNNYRLIATVIFAAQIVVIEQVLTYAEYSKKY